MPARSPGRELLFPVLLLAVLAVAAYTGFHEIGRKPFWFDEGASLGMVRLPFDDFVRHAWDGRLNNQVFYYLALRPWHLLGESEATLRAFSALCAVGAVAAISLLGRKLFGTAAGLTAGALLAVHWFSIRYAQEARAYALAALLACIAALLLARFLERGRRRDLAGWVLVSGLTFYAHFFGLFTIAAQTLSVLALGPRELNVRRMLLAGMAGVALLAAPILVFLAGAPPSLLRWIRPVSIELIVEEAGYLAGGGPELPLLYLVMFAVLLVRIFAEARPLQRWGNALALSWATFPLLAMAAASLWNPILLNRYLLMSVPAWPLVAGAVLGPWMEQRRLAAFGYALLCFVLVSEVRSIGLAYNGAYEDWKTPAEAIANATLPGDAILYNHPWSGQAFGYYLDRAPRQPEALQPGPLLYSGDFDAAEAATHDRIWLVLSRPDRAVATAMHAALIRTHPKLSPMNFGPLRVVLYERDAAGSAAGQPAQPGP